MAVLMIIAQAQAAEPLCSLDIDGNGQSDAATDGQLVLRHLFGFGGETLTEGVLGRDCTRCDAATLLTYLDSAACQALIDVDGDGRRDALSDGLLAWRYLLGYRGDTLAEGATSLAQGAQRTDGLAVGSWLTGAGRYEPIGTEGSVIRDTVTGLEWQRCSVGQMWNPTTNRCDDDPNTYAWNDALGLTAPGGFRLPTINELRTLVYCSTGDPVLVGMVDDDRACIGSYQQPSIAEEAFPDTPLTGFWTSSRDATLAGSAWMSFFATGAVKRALKLDQGHARLVRQGLHARYQPIEADASIIRDMVTGLEWQRCSVGQTWNPTASRCDGSPNRYRWDDAAALNAPGRFRVPTIDELRTLVYCSTGDPVLIGMVDNDTECNGDYRNPTIGQGAFPDTPSTANSYWSSSRDDRYSNHAWLIRFRDGRVFSSFASYALHVRLVREGSNRYEPMGADAAVILDTVTGLEWQRCSVGQTWNPMTNQCDGDPSRFDWDAAVGLAAPDAFDGHFRLPSIEELRTLVYCSTGDPVLIGLVDNETRCAGDFQRPTILAHAFPDTWWNQSIFATPSYWSSSSDASVPGVTSQALQISFGLGGVESWPKDFASPVRLVRQWNPRPRYEPIGLDGSVIRDAATHLDWQRCSVGQTWNSQTHDCDGEATRYSWADAVTLTAPPSDFMGHFRLPSIEELRTLVYCSTGDPVLIGLVNNATRCAGDFQRPTILAHAFPDTWWNQSIFATPSYWSWSSDASVPGVTSQALQVSFGLGGVASWPKDSASHVRLVRKWNPRYEPIGLDGSVIRDTDTLLDWQRCSVGQTWNSQTHDCDGEPTKHSWRDAITLSAPGGFRIPSIDELRSLRLDNEAFPDMPSEDSFFFYWSGSLYSDSSAWIADFGRRVLLGGPMEDEHYVRLVRPEP